MQEVSVRGRHGNYNGAGLDIEAIRRAVDPKSNGKGAVRCPAHDDRTPSLSIDIRGDQLVCHCHAGCDKHVVFEAVRKCAAHLLNHTRSTPKRSGEPVMIYTYADATGKPIARVLRYEPKGFRQQVPDGMGGWQWGGPKGPTPLFRLDKLAKQPEAIIVVTEGEKAALAAARLLDGNFVPTSFMGGTGGVERADLTPLRGRDVIIWPDADEPGKHAAARLAHRLRDIAGSIRMVRVDDLPLKADAADVSWTSTELLDRCELVPDELGVEPVDPAIEHHDEPRMLDLAVLATTDPAAPAFLIDGLLPRGQVALLAGDGGSGKSTVALTCAICLALGLSFFGARCDRRRVLFVSFEDDADVLHWRIRRGCDMLGVDVAALTNWLFVVDATSCDALFVETRDGLAATVAHEWLRETMLGTGARVLMIDNASDAFAGNENSRAQVRAFVRAIRRVIPRDGALLLLAHVDKVSAKTPHEALGYSGSTAWHNSVRARWYLYRDPDDRLKLDVRKVNYGRAGTEIVLRWSETAHTFVADIQAPRSPIDARLRDSDERAAILATIRAANTAGDPLPTATRGERSAHAVAEARGLPDALRGRRGKARFYAHLEALRAAGAVRVDAVKTACRHLREVYRPAVEGMADADATARAAEAATRVAEAATQ